MQIGLYGVIEGHDNDEIYRATKPRKECTQKLHRGSPLPWSEPIIPVGEIDELARHNIDRRGYAENQKG